MFARSLVDIYTARLVRSGWQGHLVLTRLAHLDPLTPAKPGKLGKPGCRECEWSQGGGLPLPLLTLTPAFATLMAPRMLTLARLRTG